ncbi:putative ABC transporter ATP-binding subunit [Carbonactinospora thermoautotrophica]|uniref:Putative ABC transporter ATP-binding subunit n=1 Tax=Carbonactinospora thermoautotrophica TaxID=1469144 RepID=A0A132MMS5_9ACTN|nr:ABC-F family ATP-binding cassette domain-containing protein [Carbonactinospora thermoautotrophica]KWW99093.1 putative ABC transporter ATP-binding subunit [Carbonactinospora thermoautotrophica]
MTANSVNLVNLETVSKAYGTRILLDAVSLGVGEGERIGVVGRNGDGKTTLISILAGRDEPDSGRVTHVSGLRLGLLTQHDDLDPATTVGAAVVGSRPEHEWAGDPRVRDVLTGLFGGLDLPGFADGMATRIGALSGGERRRVALARILIADQDLIVLDEPTNHLDVEGIDWLARHLAARKSALVVVTHDRWFLDAVCTRTWEVQGGRVHEYDGGYSAYVLAKAERARIAAAEEAKRQNLLRKELAWLRRGAPARTSKPKFRIEAANALIADEPPPRDSVELVRFAAARLGKTVYELHDVTLRAGEKTLLDRCTWRLGPGDRIGVVGVNGSGKTSLLRLLAGELRPAAGRVVVGKTVRPGYLSQHLDELDPAWRVLEAVERVGRVVDLGKGRELTANQLCERFGFTGEKQWTPVRDLSGGERRRLQLLRLLMGEPNVLLLDEPTNDLDIETLSVLEDLLDGWPGSLVVVSHDRYFVERVCDHVVALLGDGRLAHLGGGIDEYLERRSRDRTAGATRKPRRRGTDPRAARKELARVERQLDRLAAREQELYQEMALHASDYEKLVVLDAELKELLAEKDRLEERWLELADETEG